MTTYDDSLLAARFAALAPEPLGPDWDDVLDRVAAARRGRRRLEQPRPHLSRRRRLLVALVAVTIVAAATTAAWAIVRVFLDEGFVGLPPVGAAPSAPASGELVLSFRGRSITRPLHGRMTTPNGNRIGPMTGVFVYADGRLITLREGGAAGGANEATSGFLEQRLTAAGVTELLSRTLSTGLFTHDLALRSSHGLAGTIQARNHGRLVRVAWQHPDYVRWGHRPLADATTATPAQERALERLDALLNDPTALIPPNAWQDRVFRAYVPSRYAVCWQHRPELGPDVPTRAIRPSRVLALLPEAAVDLIRRHGFAPRGSIPPSDCAVVPTEEARAIAQALDNAGLEEGVVGNGIDASLGGLTYRFKAPGKRPGHIYVSFEPTLPHGEWVCTPCG
jgi:hypothetical protein